MDLYRQFRLFAIRDARDRKRIWWNNFSAQKLRGNAAPCRRVRKEIEASTCFPGYVGFSKSILWLTDKRTHGQTQWMYEMSFTRDMQCALLAYNGCVQSNSGTLDCTLQSNLRSLRHDVHFGQTRSSQSVNDNVQSYWPVNTLTCTFPVIYLYMCIYRALLSTLICAGISILLTLLAFAVVLEFSPSTSQNRLSE